MRINQNIAAFNAYRNLSQTQGAQAKSLEKLSSGFRINRAADDASGLVNSENLRAQIGGLKVATRNAQDAISLVQTAEGAQTEVHSILQRMRDLTVQSGNLGTNDAESLKANQAEFAQLRNELDRISEQTQFGTKSIFTDFSGTAAQPALGGSNTQTISGLDFTYDGGADPAETATAFTVDGVAVEIDNQVFANRGALASHIQEQLTGISVTVSGDDLVFRRTDATNDSAVAIAGLDGTNSNGFANSTGDAGTDAAAATGGAVFQVGANAEQNVRVVISDVSAEALGLGSLNIGEGADEAAIDAALEALDEAISTVSANRADLGAFQNRMESTIRNVGVAVENLQAAESRIRDTDMAEEMVSFTRAQILSQAGTAMLAQANQVPQSVLSLLR